jgi:hypothetical protein
MPQLCTFGASSARGFGLTEETGPGLPDDQFNLTTLLLPGNGTNGAQNNTFLDSSTNNFTVTRNGNTTQGTFSPFSFGGGTAQANGYYSGYFDGTGDYLSVASNAAFALGTGDFCIEGWYFVYTNKDYNIYFDFRNGIGTAVVPYFYSTSTGDVDYFVNGVSRITGSGSIKAGQWSHIAVIRSGTATKLFINGVQIGSTYTDSNNYAQGPVYIGRNNGGGTTYDASYYCSNFRVVKGTTGGYGTPGSTITVPTTPLTNITNTSLLTCQSSQFIDNSANAFTITVNGNPQPTVVNPFGMTDWSGYFDGTGDYLTVANNAAFDLGSGNATIEAWIYPTSSGQTCGIFDKRSSGANYSQFPQIALVSGAFVAYVSYSGSSWAGTINGATPAANTWTHVAFVRSGNTWTLYVNGAVSGTPFTASGSVYTSTDSLVIGASTTTGTNAFAGQISNARVVKGTAVYTSNFTVPTAPLTAISGTSLLTCQSSTFIDNSTNAFAITVNGNAYTGTLNNPFGSIVNYTTPPLQAWSNYFDGSGDYLNVSYLASNFGTGDFTLEMFVYLTAYDTVNDSVIIDTRSAGTANPFVFGVRSNGFAFYYTGTGYNSSTVVPLNNWVHLVICRSGTTLKIFQNGVETLSRTDNSNLTGTSTGSIIIGRAIQGIANVYGYLSNLRIVKGTAVYTAAFTPPTAPLTATANTSLLTCQSNGFVDNSINRFAITQNGDTSVQPFSPFNPDAVYSTTSVGGSMYFDGTGDYLSIADNATLEFGSSDFTIEAFIYPTATTGANRPIWSHGTNNTNWMSLYLHTAAGRPEFVIISGGSTIVDIWPADVISPNIWYHLAVTRSGSTFRMFLNGALIGTGTNASAVPDYTDDYRVGYGRWNGDTGVYAGNISGLRILKGTALYTTPFVPPVLPLTNISNTSLLLNATNAGIPDATAKNVLETVGNAQISTAQSKFGGSSMAFDGTGDYIVQPTNFSYGYGTGDFTIEFWLRLNTTSIQTIFSNLTSAASTNPHIYISSTLYYYTANAIRITGASLSAGQWYHIAVCRASGSTRLFVNGTQSGSTYTDANNYGTTAPLGIGTYWASGSPVTTDTLNGYIDDLRITKGYARYTTNFTPPTQAFPLF